MRAREFFVGGYIEYISRHAGNDDVRYMAVGELDEMLYTIVFTRREEKIRIISFRRSRDEEKRKYCQLYDGRN